MAFLFDQGKGKPSQKGKGKGKRNWDGYERFDEPPPKKSRHVNLAISFSMEVYLHI